MFEDPTKNRQEYEMCLKESANSVKEQTMHAKEPIKHVKEQLTKTQ